MAFLAVAAASLAMLVGSAVGGLTTDVRGRAFGHRQVAFGVLVLVIGAGLFLQALAAAGGGWAVGRRRIPAAWPVVAASAQGPAFRVLWLGSSGGAAFPPPGGAPDGVVATPDLAVRYGVTSSSGRRLASLAVPPVGHGYRHLEAALGAILDGRVRHGGSILGAMGIRYVVAGSGDLDRPVVRTLRSQADLALIQREGGLQIYHVAAPRPVGWRSAGPVPEARSRDLTAAARLEGEVQPLRSVAPDAWRASPGSGGPGVAVLAVDHDPRWRLDGSPAAPFAAFGWGVGFETSAAEPATMRFTGQGERRLHLVVLAMLWGAALWVTRRRAG